LRDQNIKAGDSINLKYFTVGPLRKLTESEAGFIVKEVVPIKGFFADRNLMPLIPGLSDAGNCRDGKPVSRLSCEIRDKDEKYWDDYQEYTKSFYCTNKSKGTMGKQFWLIYFSKVPE